MARSGAAGAVNVSLPHIYEPRAYQLPFWDAMRGGCKRAALVWHRRAGKDVTSWNYLITQAAQRVGVYYYFGPTYSQTKKFLWDGITNNGLPFLHYIPEQLVAARNETEMQIVLPNKSIIQIVGTENIDRVRGTNPLGVVFSEYAVGSPSAWKIIEPALLANGGWAVFVFTPKGQNHGYKLWQAAKASPDRWFASLLTIDDTRDESGRPIVSPEQIEAIRKDGTDEETIQQEYYCSFHGAISGAYYAAQMRLAEEDGRIREVPWDPQLQVQTWWDLGVDDSTTIWFTQEDRQHIRVIDYEEESGEGLPFYAKLLKDKPYVYSEHVMPHDIGVTDLSTGVERRVTAIKLGIRPIIVAAKIGLQDGIEASRALIGRCYFDERHCSRGITALKQYRKEYDEERGVYKKQPLHDEWSHGADGFRTGAVGRVRQSVKDPDRNRRSKTEFNPLYDR